MPERFAFSNLRELFAKANEEKSGDQLAGVAARSEQERVAAKEKLADLTLAEILQQPLIDPDHDDVSHVISETFDQVAFRSIQSLTVGEFREHILYDTTGEAELKQIQWAIIPEIAAAAAKIMSNNDLILAAAKIRNVSRCRNTMGQQGVLGIRTQANHPSDDIGGILLAAFEGLLYGCGDAVIGVNPATDSVETVTAILNALNRLVDTYKVPTQTCALRISPRNWPQCRRLRLSIFSFSQWLGPRRQIRASGSLRQCCGKAVSRSSNIIDNATCSGREPM